MAVLLSVCSRLKKAGKTFFRWKPYEGIGGMVATNWSQTLLAKVTPTTWLLQWFIMWTSSRQHAAQCWASPGYVVCVSQVLLAFKCRSLYSPPHCFGRYYCMSCKRYCDALPQLACIYKYHAGSWILNNALAKVKTYFQRDPGTYVQMKIQNYSNSLHTSWHSVMKKWKVMVNM